MAQSSLDSRITLPLFLKGIASKLQGILAQALSPEEKLALIIDEMEKDVAEKRTLARQIGAQMRALADPDTATVEPLEALRARRAKLVSLGGDLLNQRNSLTAQTGQDAALAKVNSQLGQVQQEVQSLDDGLLKAQEVTYQTLQESYQLARSNYQTALSAWETARASGPAILNAIRANDEALELRTQAQAGSQKKADTSFLNDLTSELTNKQAALRADHALDADLDASKVGSVDDMLAARDAQTLDSGILAEFSAAAAKKA